jgi:acylphosphatase
MLQRVHAIVGGRVQGVFFRACTRDEAERLALVGWVRNLTDGSVETEFEGESAEVSLMLNWLRKGSPGSNVAKVTNNICTVLGNETCFTVRY